MCFLSTNLASTPLVFIPNLLKPPAATARNGFRPACPTRQPLGHPAFIPSPPASRLPTVAVLSPNASSRYHAAPSIVNLPSSPNLQALPLITVPASQPTSSFKSTNVTDSASVAPACQRRGHRHTEESRRKIGIANRGNTPWNKGRRHSEETKRKIAENTKRAMLRPEMRQMLQQRAKGRKHTEATKLKIRETARLTRGTAKSARRREKKCPVPYDFAPDVVKHLNDCIAKQIEETFVKDDREDRSVYVVREKRVVSEDTRQKLSRRIKEMWNDPDYRSRVASGVEERYRRLAEGKKTETSQLRPEESSATKDSSRTKRRPRLRKQKEANESPGAKRTHLLLTDPAYDNSADIVLDPDSLKGWTKEDLGIVGTHGAGRIDQQVTSRQDEISHSHNQNDCYAQDGQRPRLREAETLDGTEISYEEGLPVSKESSDSMFSSPFQTGLQELDFSRLDIANDYALSSSYGNHIDFLEEAVPSFPHEQGVDTEIPVGSLDQGDDYFSGSMVQRVDQGSNMESDNSLMVRRPSLNCMDEEAYTFESF